MSSSSPPEINLIDFDEEETDRRYMDYENNRNQRENNETSPYTMDALSEEEGDCGDCGCPLDYYRDGTTEDGDRCNNCYAEDHNPREPRDPIPIISPDYRPSDWLKKNRPFIYNEQMAQAPRYQTRGTKRKSDSQSGGKKRKTTKKKTKKSKAKKGKKGKNNRVLPQLKPVTMRLKKYHYRLDGPSHLRHKAIDEGIQYEVKHMGKTPKQAATMKKGRLNILRIYRRFKKVGECNKITKDMRYIDKKYKLGTSKNICGKGAKKGGRKTKKKRGGNFFKKMKNLFSKEKEDVEEEYSKEEEEADDEFLKGYGFFGNDKDQNKKQLSHEEELEVFGRK